MNNNLEQLADLLSDAIVNLDPQEFEAVAGAAGRLKREGSLHACPDFATLFSAIEAAVVTDPPTELPTVRKADRADAYTHLREVTVRPERRNIRNWGRRQNDLRKSATG
jgi:hypothetical protein